MLLLGFVTVCFVIIGVETLPPLSTATGFILFSSCTTTELIPQVPNVVYIQTVLNGPDNYSCNNTVEQMPQNRTLNWSYHATLPPPVNCCSESNCLNTTVSTYTTTVYDRAIVGGNLVVTTTGTVIDGPYTDSSFTRITTSPIADSTKCLSSQGLEVTSGTSEFTITTGPTCTGVVYVKYCPGLHFE